ncbi:MAG: hypothetical protein Q8835_03510, partial [Sweet potato little leaf phytoplasma]|nr:hypothetical protein [Sweet potato little leaf phytoplasma]
GYQSCKDIYISMDIAASEFFDKKNKKYVLSGRDPNPRSTHGWPN